MSAREGVMFEGIESRDGSPSRSTVSKLGAFAKTKETPKSSIMLNYAQRHER